MVQAGSRFEGKPPRQRPRTETLASMPVGRDRVRRQAAGSDLGETPSMRSSGASQYVGGRTRGQSLVSSVSTWGGRGPWLLVDQQGDPPALAQRRFTQFARGQHQAIQNPALRRSKEALVPLHRDRQRKVRRRVQPRHNRSGSPAASEANPECEACASILSPAVAGLESRGPFPTSVSSLQASTGEHAPGPSLTPRDGYSGADRRGLRVLRGCPQPRGNHSRLAAFPDPHPHAHTNGGWCADRIPPLLVVRPPRWKTVITQWKPPHFFVDQQLSGPYTGWEHTHSFQEEDGGTRMFDSVRYELPLGVLGEMAHRMRVRQDLERIFDYRAEVIQRNSPNSRPEGSRNGRRACQHTFRKVSVVFRTAYCEYLLTC